MANRYSDRQMLDWIILRASRQFLDRLIDDDGPTREDISAAMEQAGIEPEPVETVTMAELMMVFAREHLGNCRTRLGRKLDRERAVRAVLALAEGKTVKEN